MIIKHYNSILRIKVIFFTLIFSGLSIGADKIGYVNMQMLIDKSPQIQHARDSINVEFENQYQTIKTKELDFKELEEQITRDGAMMVLEDLNKLQERARILERQIRRAKEDLKDNITIRNTQKYDAIQKELGIVVKQYAVDNGYDAIFINEILYVSDAMNITQEILKILNTKEINLNNGN